MKKLLLIVTLLFTCGGFAESYDAVSSVINKIEEGRFKGSVVYAHIHGDNADVDAAEDLIPAGGNYVGFPGGAGELFEVFSSDAADDGAPVGTGARTVRVYYCDDDKVCFDSNGDWLTFDIILNGTTGVDSTVSGRRVWKVEVLTSGSGGTNAGTITVRNKTTTANIFSVMQIGYSISTEGVFTIPSGYSGYLESWSASLSDTTANRAVFGFTRGLDNGTVLRMDDFVASTGADNNPARVAGIKFNEKEDIKMRVHAVTAANGNAHGSYRLRLVKNP